MDALSSVLRAGGGQYILRKLYNLCRQIARNWELNGVNIKQRSWKASRMAAVHNFAYSLYSLRYASLRYAYAGFSLQLFFIAHEFFIGDDSVN